ncbi:single-stranded DNA-binding protein [Aminobacter sp. MSH1]|uniref:single-stranded DNA-binding protein n=1 Tax=Aminobacter sp. MSH1 TaxID=374606 RepID=UPI000D38C86D|nr:single-stranded DNA-binding protein [Aminobacter sp. MSH1]
MQQNIMTGRLAGAPELRGTGDKAVCRFTLIDNEYAGKDDNNQAKTRTVSVPFVAFRHDAKRIHEHCRKGDQLIVTWSLRNNNYEKEPGQTVYGYDFVVEDVEFGAPGPEKRAEFQSGRQHAD